MESYQGRADALFASLNAGDISRQAYVGAIDELYLQIPKPLRKNLTFRKDGRSLGQFALAIYDTTRRERFLVDAYAREQLPEGWSVLDSGVANDGRLVIEPQGRGSDPDFTLVDPAGNRTPLEIKFGPTDEFVTYKVADLEHYAEIPGLVLLTFIVKGMVGPNGDPDDNTPLSIPRGTECFTMGRRQIKLVLREGERGRHRGFGGKETVRVPGCQFHRFFMVESLFGAYADA